MQTQWVSSSAGLPPEGQAVEFVLYGRAVAMIGVYCEQVFRSRWSGYDIERIRNWRSVDFDAFATTSPQRRDSFPVRSSL